MDALKKVANIEEVVNDNKKRVEKVENSLDQIKKNQDEFFIIQSTTLDKLEKIHICLAGTDYDKNEENGNGGGLVKRLSRVEKCIQGIAEWKLQLNTINKIIYIIAGAILTAIWTVIVLAWDTLF